MLRVLMAFTCFLFVVSVFLPFLSAGPRIINGVWDLTVKFWSFKGVYEVVYLQTGHCEGEEHLFSDYWWGEVWPWAHASVVSPWASFSRPILILMLVAQILTFSFTVLSLLVRRLASVRLGGATFFNFATINGSCFWSANKHGISLWRVNI